MYDSQLVKSEQPSSAWYNVIIFHLIDDDHPKLMIILSWVYSNIIFFSSF